MDHPRFVDEETIPLVDEDYDNYGTPKTSRVDETSFTEADTTEATSTLRLKQKVKRHKLAALYRHLTWIDLSSRGIQKKRSQFLSFTMVIDGFL